MVRISTDTQYKLTQAVEKSETQYTNSIHTYYLDKIIHHFQNQKRKYTMLSELQEERTKILDA